MEATDNKYPIEHYSKDDSDTAPTEELESQGDVTSIDNKPGSTELDVSNSDFRAIGNEPSWTMDILFGEQLIFKSLSKVTEFTCVPGEGVVTQDANITRYRCSSDDGDMIITLRKENCSDKMSDNTYPYSVRVEIKRPNDENYIVHSGCGRYLPNPALKGVWEMTHLGNKQMSDEDFMNGLPLLKFKFMEYGFSGSTGCNKINGSANFEKDQIKMFDIGMTKMGCPGNLEQEVLKAIRKTNRYEISADKLIFYQDKKVMAVYVRKEIG